MNYLAHALLASHSDDAMLGAFLGDFVKGSDAANFADAIATEIAVHRRIDTFTDAHAIVLDAKRRFDPSRRRFAGIALDVFYDHVLARDWNRYHPESLGDFSARFYRALERNSRQLPERARSIAERMSRRDWLGAYARFEGAESALHGIGTRLSRNGEQLAACAADLREHYDVLAEGFHALFPQLQDVASETRHAILAQRGAD